MAESRRSIFEEEDGNITLVLENEYLKIYRDPRSSKIYKIVNGEVVSIELRELNMWKNHKKNPGGFNIRPMKNSEGKVVDYEISRVARGEAPIAPPEVPAPVESAPSPTAPQPRVSAAPAPRAAAPAPRAAAVQKQPAVRGAAGKPEVTVIDDADRESRIKFEDNSDHEKIFANDLFSVYRNKRTGRTFKVIGGEVANIEVRELNMWKNRTKNPGGFIVTIVNDSKGEVYDYKIERSAAAASAPTAEPANLAAVPLSTAKPATAPAPAANTAKRVPTVSVASDESAAPAPAATAPKAAPAPVATAPKAAPVPAPRAQKAVQRPAGISKVSEIKGEKPADRVEFVNNDTTELVLETEYCKFYKDKRASKVFKVIDDEIVNIELRELNMWKNRIKNPSGFTITKMVDSAGKPFDYIISRINEDGTVTAAPVVEPPKPVIIPDSQFKQTEAPAPAAASLQTPSRSVSAPAPVPASETIKTPDKKRVKFEETPSMKMLLENEYFKIYSDSRRGATFKVINGEIAPLPQRELNMWKNRQRRPKDFAVKVINDSEGNVYDYEITRTTNTTAAVETTTTKTNLPPVTERIQMGGTFKRSGVNRISNCAICNNRYKDSELFQLNGKSICNNCMEALVKERFDVSESDPIKKNIEDVIAAETIYCTYSLVTNYPYLDEEFCVNVCTVKRAAEVGIEDTIAQEIDEKGAFFDDLKRFGLKKIKVNNDSSHVYAPEDFDSHVKSEGVIAPKLYFKVLNFMQNGGDELRRAAAESFLGSKVYTYALNQDITEITDENIDEFRPITFTDGLNSFCPVFTDFTEARAVGMPFKGLYEIETRLLAYHKITHYIINPSSLGFIMNKSILSGAKPNYDRSLVDENDERIKNIDSFINPFDLEDEVLAKLEAEKKEQEEKVIADIKAEAQKAVEQEHARAEAAEQLAQDEHRKAETALHEAEEARHNAEEARHEAEAAKITAEEAMKAAHAADEARAEAAARAENAEREAKEAEAAGAKLAEKARMEEQERLKAEREAKEAEEKAKAEREAKAAEKAKKAEAKPAQNVQLPFGAPPAAAAAFKAGGFAPAAAAAAAALNTPAGGGIFFSDNEEKKSPLDSLNLGGADSPSLPSLDLSGLADDPMIIEKEEAAPSSYYKPQNARSSEPLPPPLNEFKKTGIYGDKQIARTNGLDNQTSIYESAQKKSKSMDFYSSPAPKPAAQPAPQPTAPANEAFLKQRQEQRQAAEKMENPNDLVISSVSDGTDGSKVKKAFKVSKPLFVEDVPDDEIMATPYSDGVVSAAPVTFSNVKKTKGVNTVLSEIAQENERKNDMYDLSALMYGDKPQQAPQGKPTIQQQAGKIKATARALEVESDPMTAKELRDKLDEGYRELAKLIADADVMYAEFDAHTRHILIDGHNKGHIFSEKYLAEKSVENFARNNIKVYLQEYRAKDIFKMLFEYRRHGIQELVLDETAHWVIIPTDKIAEMLDIYERDFVKLPVMNPELMFSMTTLFQKLQTKSNNPNKEQEVRSLEKRMIREFITARYLLPMYGTSRDDLRPITIDNPAGGKKVLVFSDEFEMNRFFGDNKNIVKDTDIVNYREIIKKYTMPGESVVVLNEGSLRFEFNERNCEHISKVLDM